MKKKGFTLIELLAVIVILAVIALIATPLIMNVINDARKNSFKDSAYGIIKAVEFRAAKEQIDQVDGQNKEYKVDVTSDAITYSGDKPTSGWAYIDQNGKVELYMCNASYCASKAIDSDEVTITSNSNEMETIKGEITRISELDIAMLTKDGTEGGYVKPVNNCTFDGELVQGAEYVNGQYTYRYMQESGSSDWMNITTEGWGVALTDKTSTDPVTSKLCTSINGKPIVSMAYMFGESQTSSIDVSSFDTSNVIHMGAMFMNTPHLSSLNLDNWELKQMPSGLFASSSIVNISARNWKIPASFTHGFFRSMAGGNTIQTLDVTGWDLSNTTDINGLFADGKGLKEIKGLNTWDTSHITNMSQLFYGDSSITSLDLSGFNTSNVINMNAMFFGTSSLTALDLSGFNTSNVTNMNAMFQNTSNLVDLNLDGFDMTKVSDSMGMFQGTTLLKNLSLKNWKLPSVFSQGLHIRMGLSDKVELIDVTGWDLSNTTDISNLFNGIQSLKQIKGLNTWDTSNIKKMSCLFLGTSSLSSLDLSSFNTSNVTNMSSMFNGASGLVSLNLNGFNTSNVTNMNAMFLGTSSLTSLDLSSFDTSNVSDMGGAFADTGATAGYAKTQADADRLNASGGKPSTLTFTVK